MNPDPVSTPVSLLRRIRLCVAVVIVGLVLSGISAFPLEWQLDLAVG